MSTMSLRLTEVEEKIIDEGVKRTGLTKTQYIKKILFGEGSQNNISSVMLMKLGKLSTTINLMYCNVEESDRVELVKNAERLVAEIWQFLN